MLDESRNRLERAAPEIRSEAERMAETILAANMVEDLIPADEARTIVAEHRAAGTEEWRRMVHACLLAIGTRSP